jgi:hypothetical protein
MAALTEFTCSHCRFHIESWSGRGWRTRRRPGRDPLHGVRQTLETRLGMSPATAGMPCRPPFPPTSHYSRLTVSRLRVSRPRLLGGESFPAASGVAGSRRRIGCHPVPLGEPGCMDGRSLAGRSARITSDFSPSALRRAALSPASGPADARRRGRGSKQRRR